MILEEIIVAFCHYANPSSFPKIYSTDAMIVEYTNLFCHRNGSSFETKNFVRFFVSKHTTTDDCQFQYLEPNPLFYEGQSQIPFTVWLGEIISEEEARDIKLAAILDI